MSEFDYMRTRPTVRFASADIYSAARAYDLLCERTADLAEVTALGLVDEFTFVTEVINLSSGVLMDVTTSPVRYDRSSQRVARSGIDHYLISMYVEGKAQFTSGLRTAELEAGDICLIDMSQPNNTRLVSDTGGYPPRVVSLVLPRLLLAPLLAAPDSVQASVISRKTAFGRLVGEHLQAVRRHASHLTENESRSAVQATALLVAGGIGPARDAQPAVTSSGRVARVAAIKRYIDQHLDSPELDVSNLCRRFQMSRSALYRLFEPEGGLARNIQDRRLCRAFSQLLSASRQDSRILDLAIDAGFSSDATFIRAFRRVFGMTPGEVRFQAKLARAGDHPPRRSLAPDVESAVWFRKLAL
jgi:AraC-like DNA-binding protein